MLKSENLRRRATVFGEAGDSCAFKCILPSKQRAQIWQYLNSRSCRCSPNSRGCPPPSYTRTG
eukprot:6177956-Pleurochrysis_carterae.AAC.5